MNKTKKFLGGGYTIRWENPGLILKYFVIDIIAWIRREVYIILTSMLPIIIQE
jgi:hypothetical protein